MPLVVARPIPGYASPVKSSIPAGVWGARRAPRAVAIFTIGAALLAAGCESDTPNRPRAEARPIIQRDTPTLLRDTVGTETTIQGAEATLVTGYGIVVGLKGTGAGDAPPAVRALLEREMILRGVGSENTGIIGVTPKMMLDDPNNCVVLVSAMIAPGAPKGTKFDVLISALPGSAATSLEGGRLWTTDLRPGVQTPGGATARILARARGPVFINPYTTPGGIGRRAVLATEGRILHGGEMTAPLEMIVSLDNPSHSRSRAIASAINAKFPQQSGDREPTAKGRNEDQVALIIPARWAQKSEEFLELLKHTRVDPAFPQDWANRFVKGLQEEPGLATELSWCLQALGPVAIPALRTGYDSGDIIPRLASLRAGARLGDTLVTPHLKEIARNGPPMQRVSAIELLADLPTDPQVNLALRELVDSPEVPVRIAAYEALAARGDPTLERVRVEDKFTLDLLPAKEPLIYVSQQGEPRIAVLGPQPGVAVSRPAMVTAWDNTLMLAADSPTEALRVRYQSPRTNSAVTTERVDHRLRGLIEYFAHEPTPEAPAPGLGMSYSEVVGALYELTVRQRAIPAGFLAEQDKLQAEMLAAAKSTIGAPRPELAGETEEDVAAAEAQAAAPATDSPLAPPVAGKPTYVVPLAPPASQDGDSAEDQATKKAAKDSAKKGDARPPSPNRPERR